MDPPALEPVDDEPYEDDNKSTRMDVIADATSPVFDNDAGMTDGTLQEDR